MGGESLEAMGTEDGKGLGLLDGFGQPRSSSKMTGFGKVKSLLRRSHAYFESEGSRDQSLEVGFQTSNCRMIGR
jgi:hypothetical protein